MRNSDNAMLFAKTIEEMRLHGMKLPATRVQLAIPGARQILEAAFRYFLSLEGREARWLGPYEEVARWLAGNGGRGLLLYGACGQGKSLLGRYILPAILLKYAGKVVSVFDMQEMNRDPDRVLSRHILSLDDIGTEEPSIRYGERRDVFAEVMDRAEKEGKLVILSTNLSREKLIERYGSRVFDRILATTVRVCFEGKSLRF